MPTHAQDAYRNAGVDLALAHSLVAIAKRLAAPTRRSDLNGGDLGGFGGTFEIPAGYRHPVLVAGCDGVGTKLEIARQLNRWDTIGIDLVAMSVNDLLVLGAEPLVFLDYLATGKLSLEQFEAVVSGVAHGCQQAGCALIGGETAEMPGLYSDGKLDLAGFALGVVEKSALLPRTRDLDAGTVLIGLTSSGLHSNGYSLARRLLFQERQIDLATMLPQTSQSLGDLLLAPTLIYVKPVLALLRQFPGAVRAMVHVTGGGFYDNLPRVLPDHLVARINPVAWDWPVIFHYLQDLGQLDLETMLQTFNCGIGMILMVDPQKASELLMAFNAMPQTGCQAVRIGQLVASHEVTGGPPVQLEVL